MTELVKALTDLCKEATVYLARLNHPLLPIAAPAAAAASTEAEKPPRQPRGKKAEALPPVAPPAAPLPEMTEAESDKTAKDMAKALVQRFPKPVLNGQVDGKGQPYPEGYHKVRDLLASMFKTGKISDLGHTQRLQLIVTIKDILTKADAQAPAPQPSAADAAGIGI